MLFEESYTVFSHSANCYGREEALKRYVVLLLLRFFNENGELPSYIDNPCLSARQGSRWFYKFPRRVAEIFDSSCTKLNSEYSEFEDAILSLPELFEFQHSPNLTDSVSGCFESLEPLLDYPVCASVFNDPGLSCFKLDVLPRRVPYYAISTYYYVFAEILLNDQQSTDLESALSMVDEYCRTQGNSESEMDCFDLVYIISVLRSYGFNEETFGNIRFVETIRGIEVSWALGLAAVANPF